MYVGIGEGAYRVHSKCLPGESFRGEARCLGRFGKKTAESCVQPINAS